MIEASPTPGLTGPYPAYVRIVERILLTAFVASIVLAVGLAFVSPPVALLPPLAIGLVALVVSVLRKSSTNLYFSVAVFAFFCGFEEGLQVTEVIYGFYYLAVLGFWYIIRLYEGGASFIRTRLDIAVALFLIYCIAMIPVSLVMGNELKVIVSDWSALVMLAYYFPLKEAVREDARGSSVVVGLLVWLGLFVAFRNFYAYYHRLDNAVQLYQIYSGRIVMNDNILLVASVFSLVLLLTFRSIRHRLLTAPVFVVCFLGLIITLSRGNWLAFSFAAGIVFFVLEADDRRRYLKMIALAVVIGTVVSVFAYGNFVTVVLEGMAARFESIVGSTKYDLSMLNRFRETSAVWNQFLTSPIIGHGIGATFSFFDILEQISVTRSFSHNGYASLFFRFGIVGAGLVLFIWSGSLVQGIRFFRRSAGVARRYRNVTLAAAMVLVAYIPIAYTSNPFYRSDAILMFTLCISLVAGCSQRQASGPPEVP